jgi:hypothetical protein
MISSYHRSYHSIPRDPPGSSSTDAESFCYGADFGDEHLRLFPGAEVATSHRLTPVDNRWKPSFGPSAVGAW